MSKGLVFKQWFKSVSDKNVSISNRKHLVYIATRPGAIYNSECGFSLWGRLPSMTEACNIDDFELAKKTMSNVSRYHTVYRTIFSVDDETAKTHGFYDRAKWQDVMTRKIGVVAENMGIDRKNFCWTASMHCTKGHPHVHVMYWDNSSKVRQEFIPKERFEIIAERIRAEFGKDIYREELVECRTEQDAAVKQARLELRAFCAEANLSEALNLKHVSATRLDALGEQFAALAIAVPDRGALKYAYLPSGYKEQVNAFLDEAMKITDFARLKERYIKLTNQISDLYGNGDQRKEYNRENAVKKLYTELGNCAMSAIKEYVTSLDEELRTGLDTTGLAIRDIVADSARGIMQINPKYQELLQLMPHERTPMRVIAEAEAFSSQKDVLVKELCRDVRIRALLRHFQNAHWENDGGNPTAEEKKKFVADSRRDLYRAMDRLVQSQLQEDAGYREQDCANHVVMLLLRMFGRGSQGANRAQSQHDLLRQKSAELSETARLNRMKQREQEGGWTLE